MIQAAAELRECLVAPARLSVAAPVAATETLLTFETPPRAGSGGSVRTLTSSSSPLLPKVGMPAQTYAHALTKKSWVRRDIFNLRLFNQTKSTGPSKGTVPYRFLLDLFEFAGRYPKSSYLYGPLFTRETIVKNDISSMSQRFNYSFWRLSQKHFSHPEVEFEYRCKNSNESKITPAGHQNDQLIWF